MKNKSLHRPVVPLTPPRGAIGPELHRPVVPQSQTTPPRGAVMYLFGGEWHRPVVCLKLLPHGYRVSRCCSAGAPAGDPQLPEQFGQQRDDSLRAHCKPLPSPFLLLAAQSLLLAVLPACERNAIAMRPHRETVSKRLLEPSSNDRRTQSTRDARVTSRVTGGIANVLAKFSGHRHPSKLRAPPIRGTGVTRA